MSELDREEFKQIVRNYTEEERSIVIKTLSNEMLLEELSRRLISSTGKLKGIRDILRVEEAV
jgi:uncharacterized protein (DUF2164 family)